VDPQTLENANRFSNWFHLPSLAAGEHEGRCHAGAKAIGAEADPPLHLINEAKALYRVDTGGKPIVRWAPDPASWKLLE